jgi:hypothetical protein
MHPLRHLMRLVEDRTVLDESGAPTQPAQIAWKKERDVQTQRTVWTGLYRVPSGAIFQMTCAGNDDGWAVRLQPFKQAPTGPSRSRPFSPPVADPNVKPSADPAEAKRQDMVVMYATFFAGFKVMLDGVQPNIISVVPIDGTQGKAMMHLFGHLMSDFGKLGYIRDTTDGLRLRRKDSIRTFADVK